MQILIAEDDAVSRRALEGTLTRWGHDVVVTENGAQAWEVLWQPDAPRLAILDWMMPEIDGVEICRRVRALQNGATPYLLILTAKGEKSDIVTALDAGADDYIIKPYHLEELRARVRAGERIVSLQRSLNERVAQLEEAFGQVKALEGILPICCYCKRIRDGQNYWQQVESYISRHSGAQFSHGICPGCWESVVKPELDGDPAPGEKEEAACKC